MIKNSLTSSLIIPFQELSTEALQGVIQEFVTLILFRATSTHKDMDDPVRHETLFVNKSHIICTTPDEDPP